MQKKVVINRGDHDIRVAFLEDSKLVEYHRENLVEKSIVGNIYRGVVQDVVPGLQAAFVDVGMERNMFLHFMDIRPESLVMDADDLDEALVEAGKTVLPGRIMVKGRRPRPDLKSNAAAPVKKGDVIIVQVVKEEISDKAARVTTNLTLAGRYLVLLPFPSQSGGVSRRVAMGQERLKLKQMLQDLKTDMYSFIVRTAGVNAEDEQIKADVELLVEQWDNIIDLFRERKDPGLVHSDHDIVQRLVRDAFSTNLDEVIVDDEEIAEGIRNSLQKHLPALAKKVRDYDDTTPIFEKYTVEHQLRKALHRKIWLKSGGYLIIDEMEALTAIDVNTGRFTGSRDQEKTSYRTNMEACDAIAQQIRLRDIGGIIVVDFIDMLSQSNQNKVSDEFKRQMRYDRAKASIGRIGDFGLMVLTRKRRHQSLLNQVFDDCPYCRGEGLILKHHEIWRRIKNDLLVLFEKRGNHCGALVVCDPTVANALKEDYATLLDEFAEEHSVELIIRADKWMHREDYQLTAIERPREAGVVIPKIRYSEEEVFAETVKFKDVPELAAADQKVEAEKSEEDTDDSEEKSGRGRTRRGRRGGRRRRKTGEAPEIEETPKAAAEQKDPAATGEAGETKKRRPRPPRKTEAAPAPASAAAEPKKEAVREEKKPRGLQIVAHWGSSRESEMPQHKQAAKEPKPAPPPKSAPADAPKTKAIQVIGSWGSRSAESAKASPAAEGEPLASVQATGKGEGKPTKKTRRRRPARKPVAKETADPAVSNESSEKTSVTGKSASGEDPLAPSVKKQETKDPAAPKAARKASKKAARKSAKKAVKKAAKKAAAKSAKKATKKASKKAAKKGSKKSAKKGA